MQAQSTRSHAEKRQEETLPVPPGFAPLPTFTLKRVETMDDPCPMAIESPHDLEISSVPASLDLDDIAAIKRNLKFELRPWIVHGEFHTEGESESESQQHDMSPLSKGRLPKGVVRGCADCSNCQKVSARWDPEGACSCLLEEAPVFCPCEEEFKDIFTYIDSIRQQAEPYGLCRIIPPPSWRSPCFIEEDDIWRSCKFSAQIQRVNELQNHGSSEKASVTHETRNVKRRKLDYEFGDGCAANFISNECHEQDSQSESGPQFTLIAFKRYADYFQQHYFSTDADMSDPKVSPATNEKKWKPSELNIEGEYWRIIEKPTEEIEVLSASNLDCRSFNRGFPVSPNPQEESDYTENHPSSWDLNYVSRLPGSLLSFETMDSFSHLAPCMHVGMCFSSLPWTVGEHWLYKLQYLHLGAPRIWYGISGHDFYKFKAVQRKQSLNPCREHTELHNVGRQLSPATLKSGDIPVYRCIQRPGEFVLFLPGAYHSGFDCGFNFSASAVFAPFDWLPHGLISIELYREQKRKTSISLDRMLLRAANEAVKARWESIVRGKPPKIVMWMEASGKDGILTKVLRMRIRSEARCREYLSSASQSRKMDESFDDGDKKRECSTCCCDLYLSAASCPCDPNRFSCLRHSKHLCSCPWSDKIFLFRYLTSELEVLLEAVEGKMSAVRRWVKEDLGLALYQDNPNKTQNGPTQDLSCVEGSNGRTVLSGEDKASARKLHGEASMGNLKGKGLATSTLSDSADDTTSSSSSDLDIEAYVAHLEALKRGKLHPSAKNEGESGLKQTRESDTQLNSGGSVLEPAANSTFDKGNLCQIDNIICLSDDDD